MKFNEVRVHNNTASFSFYIVSYSTKTATHNFSLVTRIIEGEENYFVAAINIAPKRWEQILALCRCDRN
ncbi:hypothetical protein [Archaeoglobus neptunius]|uniref:hypothetical protein n=1 Tax=Archaeoglobus neptunius TaxID=2798580 RepID=UPI001925B66C|nr:hypothetical protein [Archaeoglobus neptunius]